MAASKRRLKDCAAPAVTADHPTKGNRRISLRRVMAQGRMPHMVAIWSKLGAAVR